MCEYIVEYFFPNENLITVTVDAVTKKEAKYFASKVLPPKYQKLFTKNQVFVRANTKH